MLHADEIVADAALAGRLVAAQFPQWAGLPVRPVPATGTDHALHRLGADLLIRLPRVGWAREQVETDRRWLPVLAPYLPVPVPVPVAVGRPGAGYPHPWSVVPWLPGRVPEFGEAPVDGLAAVLNALRAVPPGDGPRKIGAARGGPLAARDAITRAAVRELGDRVDAGPVLAAWEDARTAPAHGGAGVWVHGDLAPGNLLVAGGRLAGVLDFGGLGLGDPAVDLMAGWTVFDAAGRAAFRAATGADDAAWRRGRGWALSTALVALPYYWHTFPAMVARSLRTVAEVLAEL